MKKIITLLIILAIITGFCSPGIAGLLSSFLPRYTNYIYYHCADWGPDDRIYFVKQIMFEADKMPFANEVWFCSMKYDGSDKKEIKKLFEDTEYFLDLNGNTSAMDICFKTKEAAMAFAAGAKEQTGLWLINLDGSGLKRIVQQKKFRVNHPSWFPDGQHLVYEEKKMPGIRFFIAKIDREGKNKTYLTNQEEDGRENRFPAVSPDGKKIAYTHCFNRSNGERDLWLMDSDGKNKKMLYMGSVFRYADYPEWSPDGKQLHVIQPEFTIVDAETGKEILTKNTGSGKAHWHDKYGVIIDGRGSISIIKPEDQKPIDILPARRIETEKKRDLSQEQYKWGGTPDEQK